MDDYKKNHTEQVLETISSPQHSNTTPSDGIMEDMWHAVWDSAKVFFDGKNSVPEEDLLFEVKKIPEFIQNMNKAFELEHLENEKDLAEKFDTLKEKILMTGKTIEDFLARYLEGKFTRKDVMKLEQQIRTVSNAALKLVEELDEIGKLEHLIKVEEETKKHHIKELLKVHHTVKEGVLPSIDDLGRGKILSGIDRFAENHPELLATAKTTEKALAHLFGATYALCDMRILEDPNQLIPGRKQIDIEQHRG